MNSDCFCVAVAQTISLVGAVDTNLRLVEALCGEARQQGAHLILFPETHATGYSYRDIRALAEATAEPLTGPTARRLSAAAQTNGLAVCCGMFEREGDRIYNTHVVALPDGQIGGQRKGIPSAAERGVISLDPMRRTFQWANQTFGILVCADNGLVDAEEQFAAMDISLLLHPSAGRILRTGATAQAELTAQADAGFAAGLAMARRLDLHYAVANPIGFSGEDFYPGNSWILHPDGQSRRLGFTAQPEEMRPSLATGRLTPLHTLA